ncbi:hypothetical protein [Methylomonas albis]|uniref:PEP-CTERM sorting domain-containing protein n=1 Tax=Methylomonas albis TaxID=1854563 RepID=A0ABR9CZJ6_9GAMM|nr:hypothetical protein [Methylomonas albis]MBD9356292.1 hypothetical protein [Methylomonas albis]CAD6879368.1 hypothetical protein [Methylomonas albis]
MKVRYLSLFLCSILGATASSATLAAHTTWTVWESMTADDVAGTANGKVILGSESIQISYQGEVNAGGHLNGVSNYWLPLSTYTSTEISNAPTYEGRIDFWGGTDNINTLTFSKAVENPVMAIVSLGQISNPSSFVFDKPFVLLNQGPGLFGGSQYSLTQPASNILYGEEGNGIIQFIGTYTSISWSNPLLERGVGWTVGFITVPISNPALLMLSGLALINLIASKLNRRHIAMA